MPSAPGEDRPLIPQPSPEAILAEEPPEQASRFEDRIETDRDSFTPSTKTAGKGRLIVESSYSVIDDRHLPATHSFPELLLRYGVTERIELRLGWNYEVGSSGNDVSGSEAVEEEPGSGVKREHTLLYGLKVLLTKQEKESAVPESSLILQGFTPTGGEATATQLMAAYVIGWELPRRWKFDACLRYETDSEEGSRFSVWAPSAVLRVPLGERWNVHAEYFGLFSQDRHPDFVHQFFSPGVHYLITRDIEVGVRLGWGLNEQSSRFFTNVGLGWRF
jgi:hypothetical protein